MRRTRPDVEVTRFYDSYWTGSWEGIQISGSDDVKYLKEGDDLIIASAFWSEIVRLVENKTPAKCAILSNQLLNQSSHLGSFGPFCSDESQADELEKRFDRLIDKFERKLDKEILKKVFDLRVHRKERKFFSFGDQLITEQKTKFNQGDKYSAPLFY